MTFGVMKVIGVEGRGMFSFMDSNRELRGRDSGRVCVVSNNM